MCNELDQGYVMDDQGYVPDDSVVNSDSITPQIRIEAFELFTAFLQNICVTCCMHCLGPPICPRNWLKRF